MEHSFSRVYCPTFYNFASRDLSLPLLSHIRLFPCNLFIVPVITININSSFNFNLIAVYKVKS